MEEMYNVISGSPKTALTNNIDSSQTTITVDDASKLPSAPNYCTIGADIDKYEVIQYDEIDGDDLTGITREVEGTAQSFDSGTEVARYITASDINDLQQNLTEKGVKTAPVKEFSAENFDDTASLSLSWTNPPDLIVQDSNDNDVTLAEFDKVEVRRSEEDYPAKDEGTLVYEGANTNYTDTDLEFDTQYYYSIWAITKDDVYSKVAEDFGTPLEMTYDLEYGVTDFEGNGATESGDTAELSWTNPDESDFEGVLIRRGDNDYPVTIDDGTEVADITDGSESYDDTGLNTNETYYYTIWAYNDKNDYSANEYEENVEVEVIEGQDSTGSPGPAVLQAGDTTAGFFGEVEPSEFGKIVDGSEGTADLDFNGDNLADYLGITEGTGQNSTVNWFKHIFTDPDGNEKILFSPKKTIRYDISWDAIYEAGAVYGDGLEAGETGAEHHNPNNGSVRQDAEIELDDGTRLKARLFRVAADDPTDSYDDNDRGSIGPENEWNVLYLPMHINAPDSWNYLEYVDNPTDDWELDYTDEDMLTNSNYGDGSYSWGQETDDTVSSKRMYRGYNGLSSLNSSTSSYSYSNYGWRLVLEVVQN